MDLPSQRIVQPFNQVLGAAIAPAVPLVPNLIAGDIAAFKDELDPISQIVHGLSGVSIPAIFEYGRLSGPTSEPNHNIQGMRDCTSLLGGDSVGTRFHLQFAQSDIASPTAMYSEPGNDCAPEPDAAELAASATAQKNSGWICGAYFSPKDSTGLSWR